MRVSAANNLSLALAAALCIVMIAPAARAASYHALLCGSGGEAEYSEKFRDWGMRLRDTLVMRLGVPAGNVVLLTEPETDIQTPALTTTNLKSIRAVFAAMSDSVTPDDDLFVYFIGHGSYLKNISKFHVPGADLTADELDELLQAIPARRTIVLNGTSSSAGFINVLSGEGRVICTATKSVSEINATEFMGFFIEGLEDGSADRNHDDRISFLEACEQASELTASWYTSEGLIATEHAILDDNGDGLGSRLPIEIFDLSAEEDEDTAGGDEILDGALARQCYIKDYSFHPNVPQELIDTYLSALVEVEALKAEKLQLAEEAYFAQLEEVLLKAARSNRKIRSYNALLDADS
ncbi:MAG: hypothetical protein QGD90_01770 [Candidatus Hydrogenedentes bacterium]|nr:hypothetical protein [Candidatus Hydrogenedentota bacterium]